LYVFSKAEHDTNIFERTLRIDRVASPVSVSHRDCQEDEEPPLPCRADNGTHNEQARFG